MTELSLNILDVAQNSIKANATLITIGIFADTNKDRLDITIEDNGSGMNKEQLSQVEDPFFTTRTTRKVGLGISFFKLAAENTGGGFFIDSTEGKGTIVKANFILSHIDRMPLGDITATMHTLIIYNMNIDFIYRYQVDEREFTLDTRELREILENVPFDVPEVSTYIKEYLMENKEDVDQKVIL